MNEDFEYIKKNLDIIRGKVERAAIKSGRKLEDITIIGVSKTVEPEKIIRAIDEGITELGENRVQELTEKYDIINRSCNWHLIGHLQTNKVKYVVDKVKMIHSVDRYDLALEIHNRAKKIGKVVDILVQVNISGEKSKFGVSPDGALELIKQIVTLENVRVRGFMTMAPFASNPEKVRNVFSGLRKLSIDIEKENINNIVIDYLSMGMSNDYEIAIEEGANLVRIGTALFGQRQYL
ncbi:YggS family pyridoxal phosphate-dependent enzyme [Acetivibrio cellulolyticus]|uniref:YggS family pyridoxal phosphate-dependent enzyme n=1 Tax=Acetivibrio cellulolyticus TaxID=35830 RepID=UPI0001E2D475|nr:YggS family pyridoxal phosphate-dependent enzyme [Acetivibrio cellulolyticus]